MPCQCPANALAMPCPVLCTSGIVQDTSKRHSSPADGFGRASELRPGSKAWACPPLMAWTEADLPTRWVCSASKPAACQQHISSQNLRMQRMVAYIHLAFVCHVMSTLNHEILCSCVCSNIKLRHRHESGTASQISGAT